MKNIITDFLIKEIAKEQTKWETFTILMDFIRLSINNNMLSMIS